MVEVPLSEFGLLTIVEAAALKGCTPRSVQNWIAAGRLPAVVVGTGPKRIFLVRAKDVKRFEQPSRGRPPSRQVEK